MSAHGFGGHHRLDKLNLAGPSLIGDDLVDVTSDVQPERTLWLASIQDAAHNYKFYGLGSNGTSRDEFWFAVEWFFRVRSDRPETWRAARVMREVVKDEALGRRVNRVVRIPDDVLRFQCLDVLWGMLRFPIDLQTFCRRLKAERRDLLRKNWAQVRKHLRLDRTFAECEATLVCPSSPDELTDLLYAPRVRSLAVAA